MRIVKPSAINEIVNTLIQGNLVAFPTETVYGLGGDASNKSAVEKIFLAKGRPKNHPLIVHISQIEKLNYWGDEIQKYVHNLAIKFWPGPLTVIVKSSSNVKSFINGGQDSIALRMPSNLIARAILREFENSGGEGIVAPSANLFGQVSSTSARSVYSELNDRLDDKHLIVDGGFCDIGIESTIVDCRDKFPRVLRPGPISEREINSFLGLSDQVNNEISDIRYSGMHSKHYAPRSKIVINVIPIAGDGLIALDSYQTPKGVFRLAAPKNSREFAYVLYESFRYADSLGLKRIVAILPEGEDLEIAINDRVKKASSLE